MIEKVSKTKSSSMIKPFALSVVLSLIFMLMLLALFFTYKPNSILGWSTLYLITFPVVFALLIVVSNKWTSMKAIILTPFSILFLWLMYPVPHLFIPEEFSTSITIREDKFIIPDNHLSIAHHYYFDDEVYYNQKPPFGFDIGSDVMLLSWSPEEISKLFPGYTEREGIHHFHVHVGVEAPLADNLAYRRSNEPYKDAFLLTGDYRDSNVEFDEKTDSYNVFGPFGSKQSWVVFRIKPGNSSVLPELRKDYVIGNCHESLESINCSMPVSYRDYELSISVSGPNQQLRGQIKNFILSKIEKWRVQ